MDGVCTEGYKFGGHLKKPSVEIPPRKLLLSTKSAAASSPGRKGGKIAADEDNNLNNEKEYCYDSDADDPYATDNFRMYEFKIRRCTRSRSHDWTDCPFAHPGEKARRRDPRRYHYSGEVCPEFRRGGGCGRGDDCEFAHGVFECWLHPSRYRTEACKDGKHCKRKVCFFAHSPRQLRVLPPENISGSGCGGSSSSLLSPASVLSNQNHRCCLFCHGSPTSTLLGLSHLSRSPSVSPPMSPANKAAMSRLRNRAGAVTYKDVLNELMSSLESMSLTEALVSSSSSPVIAPAATVAANNNHHLPWLDVGFNGDQEFQQQHCHLQFALSPSTASYLEGPRPVNLLGEDATTPRVGRGSGGRGEAAAAAVAVADEKIFEEGCGDPDLGWVNDLLM